MHYKYIWNAEDINKNILAPARYYKITGESIDFSRHYVVNIDGRVFRLKHMVYRGDSKQWDLYNTIDLFIERYGEKTLKEIYYRKADGEKLVKLRREYGLDMNYHALAYLLRLYDPMLEPTHYCEMTTNRQSYVDLSRNNDKYSRILLPRLIYHSFYDIQKKDADKAVRYNSNKKGTYLDRCYLSTTLNTNKKPNTYRTYDSEYYDDWQRYTQEVA